MRLLFTEKSLEDLARLKEFIERHDPEAAERVSEKLQRAIEKITLHPHTGRPVRLAKESEKLRELIAGRYVVRYLVSEKSVCILRIWHEREQK